MTLLAVLEMFKTGRSTSVRRAFTVTSEYRNEKMDFLIRDEAKLTGLLESILFAAVNRSQPPILPTRSELRRDTRQLCGMA